MDLNNDCWLLIIELVAAANPRHLHSLRLTSSRLRALCDPHFHNELELDLDDATGKVAHYTNRLQNTRDDLRYQIRHFRVSSQVHISSKATTYIQLGKALKCLDLRSTGRISKLQTLRWATKDLPPTHFLAMLEEYLPTTRLYVDGFSLESSGLMGVRDTPLESSTVKSLLYGMERLLASPCLHGFSSYAKTRPWGLNDEDIHPWSMDYLGKLIGRSSHLRELDLGLTTVQDRPYFAFNDGEKFPPLEALRLDYSRIFHGPSHTDFITAWTRHMDWTGLKCLALDAVSQSQCEAICNTLGGLVPNLRDLSITICGSIGPVDSSVVLAFDQFLGRTTQLEVLSLVADFPNYYHWPSIARCSNLRRLTHLLPPSFLVSRYPLLTGTHLSQLTSENVQCLECLSLDLDLSCHHIWPFEVFDGIAKHSELTDLDIRIHLTAAEYEILEPHTSQMMLKQAFRYLHARKPGSKLQKLTGTFRIDSSLLRGCMPKRKIWELQIMCSFSDRIDEPGHLVTRVLEDIEYQMELRNVLDEHRRSMQLERGSKRRKSGGASRSSRCSFESTRPLIETLRSSTWAEDVP